MTFTEESPLLVLTRRNSERIMIATTDGEIVITLVETERGRAKIGITAPKDCRIDREELLPPRPKEPSKCPPR